MLKKNSKTGCTGQGWEVSLIITIKITKHFFFSIQESSTPVRVGSMRQSLMKYLQVRRILTLLCSNSAFKRLVQFLTSTSSCLLPGVAIMLCPALGLDSVAES